MTSFFLSSPRLRPLTCPRLRPLPLLHPLPDPAPPPPPNREEELFAAAEIPEGPECRRVQHAGERDLEADHPPGPGDGDDGGPQAVGHRDELHAHVRQLHH